MCSFRNLRFIMGDKNLSPRMLFLKEVSSKIPASITIIKDPLESVKAGHSSSHSPSLKRKRTTSNTSSSSIDSSPDIRKRLLEKSVEQKLSSVFRKAKEEAALNNTITLDETLEDNDSLSLEEENEEALVDNDLCNAGKEDGYCSILEILNQSIENVTRDGSKNGDHEEGITNKVKSKPVLISATSMSRMPIGASIVEEDDIIQESSGSNIDIGSDNTKKELKLIEVKRTRRKMRIYIIEAAHETEAFRAIHKAEDNLKVPVCINGRKPFTKVPGIDYGLYDAEEGDGEVLEDRNDEEELKIIRNEKYLMDSFCCETGYLSDEELNETPSVNKVVSKVKQQRRANNIKEKKKFVNLGEPMILGPFWWTGKGGCKKELKKWQPFVLSSAGPIDTGFTAQVPEEQLDCEDLVLPVCPPAPSQDKEIVTLPCGPINEDVDYNEKYRTKYLVKFLVHRKMIESQSLLQEPMMTSSTPMVKKPSVTVTQV